MRQRSSDLSTGANAQHGGVRKRSPSGCKQYIRGDHSARRPFGRHIKVAVFRDIADDERRWHQPRVSPRTGYAHVENEFRLVSVDCGRRVCRGINRPDATNERAPTRWWRQFTVGRRNDEDISVRSH